MTVFNINGIVLIPEGDLIRIDYHCAGCQKVYSFHITREKLLKTLERLAQERLPL